MVSESSNMKTFSLGIIGTAGRREDKDRLDSRYYNLMLSRAKETMIKIGESINPIDCLVSGGAAYADHIAVKLFLEGVCKRLKLHLPAEFVCSVKRFWTNGNFDLIKNPGKTANYYHKLFSDKCKIDSLAEIAQAIEKGAEVKVTNGFMNRNTLVAKDSDALLAMTFGNREEVKDGGTSDMVEKYKMFCKNNNKSQYLYHLDLNLGEIF